MGQLPLARPPSDTDLVEMEGVLAPPEAGIIRDHLQSPLQPLPVAEDRPSVYTDPALADDEEYAELVASLLDSKIVDLAEAGDVEEFCGIFFCMEGGEEETPDHHRRAEE